MTEKVIELVEGDDGVFVSDGEVDFEGPVEP